jgi:hypothetical protein
MPPPPPPVEGVSALKSRDAMSVSVGASSPHLRWTFVGFALRLLVVDSELVGWSVVRSGQSVQ